MGGGDENTVKSLNSWLLPNVLRSSSAALYTTPIPKDGPGRRDQVYFGRQAFSMKFRGSPSESRSPHYQKQLCRASCHLRFVDYLPSTLRIVWQYEGRIHDCNIVRTACCGSITVLSSNSCPGDARETALAVCMGYRSKFSRCALFGFPCREDSF